MTGQMSHGGGGGGVLSQTWGEAGVKAHFHTTMQAG